MKTPVCAEWRIVSASSVLQRKLSRLVRCLVAFSTCVVLAVTHAQSNAGAIEGRVKNAVTGEYLNNVRVVVKDSTRSTFTDESGFYRLENVPPGVVTLRVFFTGLDEQEASISVATDRAAQQDFALTSRSRYGADAETVKLDAYVVQSTKETNAAAIAVHEQRVAPNIVSVVSTEEFGTIVDRNPGEFLKLLPGVDVEYFANNITGVSVRGLGAVNTEVNFDGMPTASANAETVGRAFEIQYASAADIARVEVRKLPLPEDSANALGGSINMIRRSAFEYSKRRVAYRAFLQSDGEELTTKAMDGPKDRTRSRWRPNWEVAWTEPINRNLGFAVTVGQNDTLVNTHWSTFGWNLGQGGANNRNPAAKAIKDAGGTFDTAASIYFPAMQNPLNHNAPKLQGKDYGSARLDWRPTPDLTLGWSLSMIRGWVQNADDVRYRWNGAGSGSGDVATFVGIGRDPRTGITYDDYTTVGRIGGGQTQQESPLWRDVQSRTLTNTFEARWRHGPWSAGARAGYSRGTYQYFDTERGFFNSTSVENVTGLVNIPHTGVGVGSGNPIPMTLTFGGAENYWAPLTITANASADYTANGNNYRAGQPVEWWKNSVARIGGARARPGRSADTIGAAKVFVKRAFNFENPLSAQLGFDYKEQYKWRRYESYAWRFVGADGLPGTADDSASLIAAESLPARRDSIYDYPAIERISMTKLYQLYQQHPDWFRYDEARSARLNVSQNAAYDLEESTLAPYLQFDWQLLRNRLRLNGGVRYEKNEASAHGLLIDGSAAYLKYRDGSVVHVNDVDANGARTVVNLGTATNVNYQLANAAVVPRTRSGGPVFLPAIQSAGNAARAAGATTDQNQDLGRATLAHTAAVYRDKAAYAEGENDNYFPSLHASFNVTDSLQWQAGYARTQARNRFDRTVIPHNDIVDTIQSSGAVGRINVRNPDLEPWVADNFETRVSYYTGSGGSFGLGVYRKNIHDYQVQDQSEILTADDIAKGQVRFEDGTIIPVPENWGLGAEHAGYDVNVYYNSGSARLDGTELEFRQRLDQFLPGWARGFSVRGTSAYNNLKGRPGGGDLSGIRDWRHTASIGYSNRRFSANVNYTMNGQQVNSIVTSNGISAEQVTVPQHMVDFNIAIRLTKWASLHLSGRNITDELRARENQYKESPTFTWLNSSNTFGVVYAIGLEGTF
ncbi:MAG: TonB-dependent receptor [Opitutaceae bacterium]|nr:TonB-dependent receptor [Opitutaceae bacterium]